jgi:hypothetical protein
MLDGMETPTLVVFHFVSGNLELKRRPVVAHDLLRQTITTKNAA